MRSMPEIVKLNNPIQHYDWGSRSALAEFQGRVTPTAEPEAEVWIGDHAMAPSTAATPSGSSPLRAWIAAEPVEVLGKQVAENFSGSLPFLVKLLAAASPLSIQVHPDADQAALGFEAEEQAGIARDAATRSYRDPNPKREILIALAPFYAMCSFRSDAELGAQIERSGSPCAQQLLSELEDTAPGQRSSAFFFRLQELHADEGRALCCELSNFASLDAPESDERHWIARLREHFPGDPLAAAPLFLNLVQLSPGDALVVSPGTVHSYLKGLGVEVMTCSDNVLRGGLTHKHIDRHELRRILDCQAGEAKVVSPRENSEHTRVFPTAASEFQVEIDTLQAGARHYVGDASTPTLLLCLDGRADLSTEGASVALVRGESALVPACVTSYSAVGPGSLLRASWPAPSEWSKL
jgi:mannose-6-phosphate isomerase